MTAQVAFLFPGQGSQAVGMGADIFEASAAARQVFEAVDEALGFSLSDLCFHGPEDALLETINAQPAIVTVSLALLAAFQEALSLSRVPALTSIDSLPLAEANKEGERGWQIRSVGTGSGADGGGGLVPVQGEARTQDKHKAPSSPPYRPLSLRTSGNRREKPTLDSTSESPGGRERFERRSASSAQGPYAPLYDVWTSPLTPGYTAGHSVGEYAALVAAGALDLAGAARLVRTRGRLMHAEGTVCPGGMAAIIGMDGETLEEICREATAQALADFARDGTSKTHPGQGQVAVANFNAPGQIVISGEQHALALAMELAKARGAKRVIPLAVSGAFHSPVMQPAATGLARAIEAANVHNAVIPIIGNIDATPLSGGEAIRAELAQQIASPVQWVRTIEYLTSAGVTVFLEIGPGQALTGMVKRIAKGVTTMSIGNVVEIEKVVGTVHEMGLLSEV